MHSMLSDSDVDRLFRNARTFTSWRDEPVPDALLRRVYDLAKWGPTSANSTPARFVFVRSPEGKERLRPAMSRGNMEQTMTAPVTMIVAYDLRFFERMPMLFPQKAAMAELFAMNDALAETTARRNSALQGAYMMIAARALGLDCGPMSGFDHAKLDAEFFANTSLRSNFLCNLGYGDPATLPARNPRLAFDDACRVV
jgi:3-hydroxypropanoate dehydrogenase